MKQEQEMMDMIIHGGDARSKAIEAMRMLKKNDFESARALMKECREEILLAHKIQTKLLQIEAGGIDINMNLLMVHAQDHLMDAMVIRDMAENLIEIQEQNYRMFQQAQ